MFALCSFHVLLPCQLQTVFSGNEKTIDPAFESAKADFLRLNEYILKIKSAVNAYTLAMKALFQSSKNACEGFSTALEDAPRPHPYEGMMAQTRVTRADMVSDRGQGSITLSMDGSVLKKLNEELELHKALLERINEREHIREEKDYYAKKVDELREKREKRAQQGKDDKPPEIEKFNRNETKLRDLNQTYDACNQLLIHDLHERFTTRVRTLGPAFNDFLGVEKEVLVLYATAVRDMPAADYSRKDVGADGDFGAADRAAMLKRQASKANAKIDSGFSSVQAASQQHIAANFSGTQAMAASYAANAAINDARSQAAPAQQSFTSFSAHHSSMASQFDRKPPSSSSSQVSPALDTDEFKSDSTIHAAKIFGKSPKTSSSSGSSGISPPPPPPSHPRPAMSSDGWDAPPMLSHIQDAGMGVKSAVSMANMNSDGSYADPRQFQKQGPHSPDPPPPPPNHNQPTYYGAPVSPPGGPQAAGSGKPSRSSISGFRMDSFGRPIPQQGQQQQGEHARGEGERSASPPQKRSLNPFDDE
jgi:hypothetical protein